MDLQPDFQEWPLLPGAGPVLACAGPGLGGPDGTLPGMSAWLPGSWVALAYRHPEEEEPLRAGRASPQATPAFLFRGC